MKNPISFIRNLYFETMGEMKKCSWPNRSELYESTLVVISTLVILSLFVTVADKVIGLLVRFITGSM